MSDRGAARARIDRVVVVGPLPPPVTGAAKNTAALADRLAALVPVHRLNISSPRAPKSVGYHADRAWRVALALPRVLWLTARHRCSLYLCISGGLGVFYDLLFLAVARLFARRTVIHHRNFTYVDRHSRGMAVAVAAAGQKATHVFLCDRMRERFRAQYPRSFQAIVVTNAAHTPARAAPKRVSTGRLTIGLLSNLWVEKGTLDFIALFERLVADGRDVGALMAGPVWDRQTETAIARAQRNHGDRFAWLGPVYGDDKDRFFDAIDLFIFPTRYPNEAEPNVVYEAMAAGVPVIATDRGCIPNQLADAGVAISSTEGFVETALASVLMFMDPDKLHSFRERAKARFMSLKNNDKEVQSIFGSILGDFI